MCLDRGPPILHVHGLSAVDFGLVAPPGYCSEGQYVLSLLRRYLQGMNIAPTQHEPEVLDGYAVNAVSLTFRSHYCSSITETVSERVSRLDRERHVASDAPASTFRLHRYSHITSCDTHLHNPCLPHQGYNSRLARDLSAYDRRSLHR